jgi:alkylation response protein AidB-like acyl-CoA dehydrogenase
MIGAIMTHDAISPVAYWRHSQGKTFSTEAVESLGESGLLGPLLPVNVGGAGLVPRTFTAVTATLAETDASVAMVYLKHVLGTTTISAAPKYG